MIHFLISCVLASSVCLLINPNDGFFVMFFIYSLGFLISAITKKTVEKQFLKKYINEEQYTNV